MQRGPIFTIVALEIKHRVHEPANQPYRDASDASFLNEMVFLVLIALFLEA